MKSSLLDSTSKIDNIKEKPKWQFRDLIVPSKLFYMLRDGGDTGISAKDMLLLMVINSMVKTTQNGEDATGCYASNKYLARSIDTHSKYVSQRITHLWNLGLLLVIEMDDGMRYLECEWSRIAPEREELTGEYGEKLRAEYSFLLERLKKQSNKEEVESRRHPERTNGGRWNGDESIKGEEEKYNLYEEEKDNSPRKKNITLNISDKCINENSNNSSESDLDDRLVSNSFIPILKKKKKIAKIPKDLLELEDQLRFAYIKKLKCNKVPWKQYSIAKGLIPIVENFGNTRIVKAIDYYCKNTIKNDKTNGVLIIKTAKMVQSCLHWIENEIRHNEFEINKE